MGQVTYAELSTLEGHEHSKSSRVGKHLKSIGYTLALAQWRKACLGLDDFGPVDTFDLAQAFGYPSRVAPKSVYGLSLHFINP